jgi:hypothetical protein
MHLLLAARGGLGLVFKGRSWIGFHDRVPEYEMGYIKFRLGLLMRGSTFFGEGLNPLASSAKAKKTQPIRPLPFDIPSTKIMASRTHTASTREIFMPRHESAMKVIVHNGGRDVSIQIVPDARIQKPTDAVVRVPR